MPTNEIAKEMLKDSKLLDALADKYKGLKTDEFWFQLALTTISAELHTLANALYEARIAHT